MPTGVFTRKAAQFAYKCEWCQKEYKHQKRYHTHLLKSKCRKATPVQQQQEQQQEPPQDQFRFVITRLAILEAQNEQKDERIRELTADVANLKRSLHYIRDKQQKANEDILRGQEELKKETQKLQHDKFWFKLHQSANKK